jgi:O-succinylbenzoate synthase
MRLESFELRHISMRLQSPFETSFGVEQDRESIILRVQSEDLEGWGECVAGSSPGFSYETVETAWHVLSDFFIPRIVGEELDGINELRTRLKVFKGHPLAKAGLELGIWDLVAKVEGISLAKMIGGVVERVPVGVSIGLQADIDALLRKVEHYIAAGYRRVKLKIKPGRDIKDVEAVRHEFPDLPLQVDANSAYSLQDLEILKALDAFGLLLIEQPLAEDDLIDHSRLQEELQTPLCLDESILSLRHTRQALKVGACRVINIKQGRVGGFQEALDIHDLCLKEDVPVWCGGMLETGIGRAANLALASLPGFTLPGDISASDRYYAEDIAAPRFTLNDDSTIDVPTGIGLGVEVDHQALDRVTLRREVFKSS